MNIPRALVAILMLGVSCGASAQAWREMYDPVALEQSRPNYEHTTRNILERLIVPVLTTEEKRRLGASVRIEFPSHSAHKLTPLDFYAPLIPYPHVAMPIFSLKFLDDLCTAYAWLQVNDFSIETVSEYTAPLLARKGPVSAPLKALQIPANALTDPAVNDLAQKHFASARTFILLHEMGHLYHEHMGSTIANEQEADSFAARLMQEIPLQPLGALVFFLANAHWSYSETTHPLSGARVKAFADHLEDSDLANAFRDLGSRIDDPEIRSGFAATAKAEDESGLAPRRSRTLAVLHDERPEETRGTLRAFQGKYVGKSAQLGNPEYPIEVVFQRQGDKVWGSYSFGIGIGTVIGEVTGNTLIFEWTWAGNSGHGAFETHDNGETFSGTWGYGMTVDSAGTWTGRRVRSALLSIPCKRGNARKC